MTEKLQKWDTVFADDSYPSVRVIPLDVSNGISIEVHAATGTYKVTFAPIASYRATEESLFPVERFNSIPRETKSCQVNFSYANGSSFKNGRITAICEKSSSR